MNYAWAKAGFAWVNLTPRRRRRVSSNGYYRDRLCLKEVFLRLLEDLTLESAVFWFV